MTISPQPPPPPPQVLVHNILEHQLVLIVFDHKDVTLKIEVGSTS
jgi:hypothetical protein